MKQLVCFWHYKGKARFPFMEIFAVFSCFRVATKRQNCDKMGNRCQNLSEAGLSGPSLFDKHVFSCMETEVEWRLDPWSYPYPSDHRTLGRRWHVSSRTHGRCSPPSLWKYPFPDFFGLITDALTKYILVLARLQQELPCKLTLSHHLLSDSHPQELLSNPLGLQSYQDLPAPDFLQVRYYSHLQENQSH